MKLTLKKTSYFIICLLFSFVGILFTGCSKEESLSQHEIVEEAKAHLIDEYEDGYVYSKAYLPSSYTVNEKYKCYITWESSNANIINVLTGKVTRADSNKNCTLTATITHKDTTDKIKITVIVPPNVYNNSSPKFSGKSEVLFQVAHLSYNDDNTFNLHLYVYNNMASQKTLKGVNNVTFSLYKPNGKYFTKGLKYTTSSRFTCKYHNYIKIKMNNVSTSGFSKHELADSFINIKIIGSFTIYY